MMYSTMHIQKLLLSLIHTHTYSYSFSVFFIPAVPFTQTPSTFSLPSSSPSVLLPGCSPSPVNITSLTQTQVSPNSLIQDTIPHAKNSHHLHPTTPSVSQLFPSPISSQMQITSTVTKSNTSSSHVNLVTIPKMSLGHFNTLNLRTLFSTVSGNLEGRQGSSVAQERKKPNQMKSSRVMLADICRNQASHVIENPPEVSAPLSITSTVSKATSPTAKTSLTNPTNSSLLNCNAHTSLSGTAASLLLEHNPNLSLPVAAPHLSPTPTVSVPRTTSTAILSDIISAPKKSTTALPAAVLQTASTVPAAGSLGSVVSVAVVSSALSAPRPSILPATRTLPSVPGLVAPAVVQPQGVMLAPRQRFRLASLLHPVSANTSDTTTAV